MAMVSNWYQAPYLSFEKEMKILHLIILKRLLTTTNRAYSCIQMIRM